MIGEKFEYDGKSYYIKRDVSFGEYKKISKIGNSLQTLTREYEEADDSRKSQIMETFTKTSDEQLTIISDFIETILGLKTNEIEALIKANLIEKYSLDKLERVIKAIIGLAALELLYYGETPAKIIIDEYISLTKSFYGNSEAGFVNKVIDTLARKTRPENEF